MFTRSIFTAVLMAGLGLGVPQLTYSQPPPSIAAGVNPAIVEDDACALFVWIGASQSLRLINTDSGIYGYDGQNNRMNYRQISRAEVDKYGQYAQQDYTDNTGRTYQLHLGQPQNMPDAVLYNMGTLTLPNEDGWLQFESVKAVSACNTSGLFSQIETSTLSAEFLAPNWVASPENITTPRPVQISEIAAPAPRPVVIETIEEPQKAQLIQASYSIPATPQFPDTPSLPEPVPSAPLETPLEASFESTADLGPTLIASLDVPDEIITPPAPLYAVQFGAFRDVSLALLHLDSSREIAPYLGEFQPEIQEGMIEGKGAFFRLRVNTFNDKSSARKFCTRLKNDGLDCFIP